MKRLLAEGFERVFQLSRVFRNGEVLARRTTPSSPCSSSTGPAPTTGGIMADLERARGGLRPGALGPDGAAARRTATAGRSRWPRPSRRLTVQEAFRRHAGVDLGAACGDATGLAEAARAAGHDAGPAGEPFDDVFFRVMLDAVEPRLGVDRPTFLVDWPASMAALARVKPDDPRWAERFELYAGGLELANGFSELNDAARAAGPARGGAGAAAPPGPPGAAARRAVPRGAGRACPRPAASRSASTGSSCCSSGAGAIAEVLLFPAHEFL